jgi:hypothetical protein
MKAAIKKLDELKHLRDQLVVAVGGGKLASMLQCLVGFTQVIGCWHRPSPIAVHISVASGSRVCAGPL